MAKSRNYSLASISRKDFMAFTEEATKVSGVAHVANACRDVAEVIIES